MRESLKGDVPIRALLANKGLQQRTERTFLIPANKPVDISLALEPFDDFDEMISRLVDQSPTCPTKIVIKAPQLKRLLRHDSHVLRCRHSISWGVAGSKFEAAGYRHPPSNQVVGYLRELTRCVSWLLPAATKN